jgi:hypothetical protein
MPEAVLDLVGAGFGPSNLAVALALDEAGATGGCGRAPCNSQPAPSGIAFALATVTAPPATLSAVAQP